MQIEGFPRLIVTTPDKMLDIQGLVWENNEMEDALKHIYNACEPYVPAPAEYYYDCAEARGSSALSQEFQNHLRLAKDYLYFLFTGHIGCGKSSELKQLERSLLAAAPPYSCYFPILLDVQRLSG